ncbi:hypothetical protein ES705_40763 [subsurface metagenome]
MNIEFDKHTGDRTGGSEKHSFILRAAKHEGIVGEAGKSGGEEHGRAVRRESGVEHVEEDGLRGGGRRSGV